jgi:hypothetical protein
MFRANRTANDGFRKSSTHLPGLEILKVGGIKGE